LSKLAQPNTKPAKTKQADRVHCMAFRGIAGMNPLRRRVVCVAMT